VAASTAGFTDGRFTATADGFEASLEPLLKDAADRDRLTIHLALGETAFRNVGIRKRKKLAIASQDDFFGKLLHKLNAPVAKST
jgi:hypothetical protein